MVKVRTFSDLKFRKVQKILTLNVMLLQLATHTEIIYLDCLKSFYQFLCNLF